MLTLLIGTDWITVRDEILRRIARDVAGKKPGRILMVPELISHDMERRLCQWAGDTASRYAEVLSFTRLARRVSEESGSAALGCLDEGGRVVAMAAAARQLHSKLKTYASVETKPEFLNALVDAVDEFKRCCISPADLSAAASQAEGTLAQKLEELSLLLSAYDGLCANGKRDPRDQMTWLLEQLEDGSFADSHTFYIDGFPDFTRQHLAIIDHLIASGASVTVGLNCDCVGSKSLAFEKAGQTAQELVLCAKRSGTPYETIHVPARDLGLHSACEALFQGALPLNVTGLQAFHADSVHQEVESAAQQVCTLVENGCRYRDISIVCADMGSYGDLLKLHFGRYGIGLYESGTEDILQSVVISTVLSALDCALGGFERSAVIRYLRSALSPVSPDLCDGLENYAVLWGVQGSRWLKPWENHPDGLGEIWTDGANRRLEMLNEARQQALQPLEQLKKAFASAGNLAEQVQALYTFLTDIGLARKLDKLARQMEQRGDDRSAQILNQLWDILLNALEQMYDVLGTTVWEPEVFTRLLRLLLSCYDVGTIPPVLDAVTVGPVSAMRCQQAKHLIVLGAAEGALPGYAGSAGLLTDQERMEIRRLGVPLTGGALEGIQAEFAEIFGVFCGAEESISVYCSAEQPSYVFRRITQMAGGEKTADTGIGASRYNAYDAAARLAAFDAQSDAEALGLGDAYADIHQRLHYQLGRVDPEHIPQLYGEKLRLSASQIDRKAECSLCYFLKYGLRAKERKEASVDPAEFGTYVHAVLEQTAGKVMELGGFEAVSLEQTMEIALGYSESYILERFSLLESTRMTYLLRRNEQELKMVVTELWQELKKSGFRPAFFELSFGDDGSMPAIDIPGGAMSAQLRGFVDRVDVWEHEGKHYFRVVDYKTGKKDFDYCDVFNGVGLQMLLYLFALAQGGQELIGGECIAAGVQYFPARSPLLSADGRLSDEEAAAKRLKENKRRGLLLKDMDALTAMDDSLARLCCTVKKDGTLSGDVADHKQLSQLREYVMTVLGNMVTDIASGNVSADPYTRGASHDACAFCPYGSICRETADAGRRNYQKMDADRFWSEIGKEAGNG